MPVLDKKDILQIAFFSMLHDPQKGEFNLTETEVSQWWKDIENGYSLSIAFDEYKGVYYPCLRDAYY